MSQVPINDLDFDAIFQTLARLETISQSLFDMQDFMISISNEMPESFGEVRREYELTLNKITFLKEQLKKIVEDKNTAEEVLKSIKDILEST